MLTRNPFPSLAEEPCCEKRLGPTWA
jgi:hypothetical protein